MCYRVLFILLLPVLPLPFEMSISLAFVSSTDEVGFAGILSTGPPVGVGGSVTDVVGVEVDMVVVFNQSH
jgi:hypothetical protein